MRDKLTPKQSLFVQEYLVDLNGRQSAIRAGYSEECAAEIAYENLNKLHIAKAIQEAMDARAARLAISQDMVMSELGKLGFSNMMDYLTVPEDGDPVIDLSSMTREQAAALTEFTVEEQTAGRGDDTVKTKRIRIKLADKRASLVDIGRNLGMFKDKLELTGPNSGPLQVEAVQRLRQRLDALGRNAEPIEEGMKS